MYTYAHTYTYYMHACKNVYTHMKTDMHEQICVYVCTYITLHT